MKFQIFKDKVLFLDDTGAHQIKQIRLDEFPFSSVEYKDIIPFIKQSQRKGDDGFTDYGYTHYCLGCERYDYIVQGYCKPCFDNRKLKYEFERFPVMCNEEEGLE